MRSCAALRATLRDRRGLRRRPRLTRNKPPIRPWTPQLQPCPTSVGSTCHCLLEHLSFVVEAGCGTSIEAGVPPLAARGLPGHRPRGQRPHSGLRLHRSPRAADILINEALTDTVRKVNGMVAMFRSILAEPNGPHTCHSPTMPNPFSSSGCTPTAARSRPAPASAVCRSSTWTLRASPRTGPQVLPHRGCPGGRLRHLGGTAGHERAAAATQFHEPSGAR